MCALLFVDLDFEYWGVIRSIARLVFRLSYIKRLKDMVQHEIYDKRTGQAL